MKISLLNGLTAKHFFSEYWQKKPLLIRNAFPGFKDFVDLHMLQDLARRDDVLSRLVIEREGVWRVQQGPLKPIDFRGLKQSHWSLLVQGIDQLLPAGKTLLGQFDFIPHARLDDLMISYAPKDGGVGPHFDSYDVFLLQGKGHKLWQISAQGDQALIPDAPLRILRRFKKEQEWILGPGDMLYLPPRYAHYGLALNDCLTYSIGFRAPTYQELTTQFLVHLQDQLEVGGLYADPDLAAQKHPAQLSAAMLAKVGQVLNEVRWNNNDVAVFMGRYLTEPKPHVFFDPPDRPLSRARFGQAITKRGVHLSLKSQLLFVGNRFFMNGETVALKGAAREFLIQLADKRSVPGPLKLGEDAIALLHDWYTAGYVFPGAEFGYD